MNIISMIFIIFALIWFYSFVSTITSEFKNNTNKIIWILLFIFLPVSAVLYPFIGKQQTIRGTGISAANFFIGIVGIVLFILFIFLSLKILHFTYDFFDINPKDYFYGYGKYVGAFFAGFLVIGFFILFSRLLTSRKKILYTILGSVIIIYSIIGVIDYSKTYNSVKENKKLIEKANDAWLKKDYITAFQLYDKFTNDKIIQNRLGIMYQYGLGTSRDYLKAIEWYKKSAKQNNYEAQNRLAGMYYDGRGVKKNNKLAFQWYQKSADNGYSESYISLALSYYSGEGTNIDINKSFKYMSKGYAHYPKNNQIQYFLGNMYYNGEGTQVNKIKAKELFMKSAQQNNKHAIKSLKELEF